MFDVRLGFALMRDRRVPLQSKLFAILIGLAVTGVVEFFELPIESILAMLLPFLGAVGDVVIGGAEAIAGPLLLAGVLLPFLAPRDIVDLVHAGRSAPVGAPKTPIIDI